MTFFQRSLVFLFKLLKREYSVVHVQKRVIDDNKTDDHRHQKETGSVLRDRGDVTEALAKIEAARGNSTSTGANDERMPCVLNHNSSSAY
jgi:hypothetical protein